VVTGNDAALARIAVEPQSGRHDTLVPAVEAGGGTVVAADDAVALVWADPARPDLLASYLRPHHRWIQLPYAGIENFVGLGLLDRERIWTCGKGVYAEPVAEHVLACLLAGFRGVVTYARARSWSAPEGQNLHGARVLVLGGGAITAELLPLLAPFGCEVVVLRREPDLLPGAARVATLAELHAELPAADAVVVALALTPATRGVIGTAELRLMAPHAWLVNVARGAHVDTAALTTALAEGWFAGAALDVTDPEPLPADHPLWAEPRCLITPHVANTPEMGERLLARRVTENVRRWLAGEALLGPVDVDLGY
jgi:phosphoglycerate dehydrogenase-like enzyme